MHAHSQARKELQTWSKHTVQQQVVKGGCVGIRQCKVWVSYVSSRPAPRFEAGVLSGRTSRLSECECKYDAKAMDKTARKTATAESAATPTITRLLLAGLGLDGCSDSICIS